MLRRYASVAFDGKTRVGLSGKHHGAILFQMVEVVLSRQAIAYLQMVLYAKKPLKEDYIDSPVVVMLQKAHLMNTSEQN